MRALVLIMSGTILTAAPAQAQTYDPNFPICLQSCALGGSRSSVTTHRWRNAMPQRRAARPNAISIPFLRSRISRQPRRHARRRPKSTSSSVDDFPARAPRLGARPYCRISRCPR